MEVTIDFTKIKDSNTFHSAFKERMGFPEFYGNNMDAWIDCMSYIDDPDAGMSSVTVRSGFMESNTNTRLKIIAT